MKKLMNNLEIEAMRQIAINIMCGFTMLYAMPARSAELLMLEQQLATLAYEELLPKSVRDLLKDRYKEFRVGFIKNPPPLSNPSQDVVKYRALYDKSIGIPTQEGHVNWGHWLKIYPHQLNENEVHALYSFWHFIEALDMQINFKVNKENFNVDKLDDMQEFNELVSALEAVLPEQSIRKAKGQELLRMWDESLQINKTVFIKEEKEAARQKFFKQYPDAAFWAVSLQTASGIMLKIICKGLSIGKSNCKRFDTLGKPILETLEVSYLYYGYANQWASYPGTKENPQKVTFISEPSSDLALEPQKPSESEQKAQVQQLLPVLQPVKDILKTAIREDMQYSKNAKRTDFSERLAKSKKWYEKSIGMPINQNSQHLDWLIWMNSPSLNVVDIMNAFGAFWRYADSLYSQILHIMTEKKISVENLEKIQEFNDLVYLLELALPVQQVRESIGKEIVEIWERLADLQSSSIVVDEFIKQRPIEFLWMEYFEALRGHKMRRIIEQALLINGEDDLKYYENARSKLQSITGYMDLHRAYLRSDLFQKYA
jgi:hypothetical protein